MLADHRPELTEFPPEHLIRLIGSKNVDEFLQSGQEFREYFLTLGKMKLTDTILEIGCGCGRMAFSLLDLAGTYHGIDVNKEMIDWCQQKITTTYPRFTFSHVDISNKAFNPDGKLDILDFRINYYNYYDFIFLTSVFTHVKEDGFTHYMREITKALKPGGKVFSTFFILNKESRELIGGGKADWNFCYPMTNGAYFIEGDPEAALAYNGDFILKLFHDNGFTIDRLNYGGWCGRKDYLSYQDIIIATKE